ncbi:hypothetical protein [Desertivirga brevis]|uniref:hypothetical protein n=1 Tax=Desertivirga brevis TaxID=2810310 RepID=UPI001A959B4A|nr:hypothetical protein [Pedobacter sp. SYSU D00873]
MKKQDGEQYNIPGQPDKGKPDPHLPTDDEKNAIRSGAKNEDQLEQLKPQGGDDKAAGEVGSPPVTRTDQGDKEDNS